MVSSSPMVAQPWHWGIKTGITIHKFLPNRNSFSGSEMSYRATATPIATIYAYYKPENAKFDLMFGQGITKTAIRTRHYVSPTEQLYIERKYLSLQFELNSGLRLEQLKKMHFRPYLGFKLAADKYLSTSTGVNTFTGNVPPLYFDEIGSTQWMFYPYISGGIELVPVLKKRIRFTIALEYNYAPGKLYLHPIYYTLTINQAEIPISGSNSYIATMVRLYWVKSKTGKGTAMR
ncbi:hypothetical protein BH09BAC1_BH09BAC1_00060 [soil metagenome]